jgi:ketosteroid isomerase-like protein
MTDDPRIRSAIRTYFEAINAEQWDRLAALFHDDAELHAPGTAPRVGGAAVASYYDDALRPYPVHRDEPTRELYAGDTVTVEIHFEGTLANGRRMAFDAVDVFDFRDGRIARLSSWYDSQRVVAALVEAVAAGAGDEAAGLAALTPARRRHAFARVRRAAAFRLGDGHWTALDRDGPDAVITGRAVLIDLPASGPLDADALDAAAAGQGVPLRAGDVALLHAGGRAVAAPGLADWALRHGLAAVASDGPALSAGPHVAAGAGFALDALAADTAARGVRDGLFVSLPGAADPAPAHAVVFR